MIAPFDYTVVITLDAHYIQHFEQGYPTLRRFRSGLFEMQWLFLIDSAAFPLIRMRLAALFGHSDFRPRYAVWPPESCTVQYESQRHRMLAAYVHGAVMLVETPWMMKLDADAYATSDEFGGVRVAWEPWTYLGPQDVYAAPAWSYTKPPDQMAKLDAWANGHHGFKHTDPLKLPVEPDAKKCRHRRMCSWVSWYEMGHLMRLQTACPPWKLPVPSQDGFVWYCTERLKGTWARYPAKALGWRNAKHPERHRAECEKALEATCTAT